MIWLTNALHVRILLTISEPSDIEITVNDSVYTTADNTDKIALNVRVEVGL